MAGAYPAGGRNAYFGTKESAFQKMSDYLNKECLCYKKTYITLLFLLVASSAFAQKTERDYLRSGNKLYNDMLVIKRR